MRIIVKILSLALIFLFSSVPATAQKKKKVVEQDTIQVPFFHGIALHVDLVGIGQLLWSDHGQIEGGLRVNLKDRYFPAFEFGYGKADEAEDFEPESWCKVKAPYFRIGCDFNILRDKHDNYKLFVGLRYGISKFSYDMSVKYEALTSEVPEEESDASDDGEEVSGTVYEYREYKNLKATYHWFEGLIGVDAKIWGPLHLGWDVRYRRQITKKCAEEGAPWYVPGFGDTKKGIFTMTFNLTFSI